MLNLDAGRALRVFLNVVLLIISMLVLAACSSGLDSLLNQNNELYVPDLLTKAQQYNGKNVVVNGTYIGRNGNPNTTILSLGVSTLDNGLDAQPLGDQIWLDDFPAQAIKAMLHQPGDAVYGFVRVTGRFGSDGGYGPGKAYRYRIQVTSAEPIEQVRRKEVHIPNDALGDGKVAFRNLFDDPTKYNNQTVTTRGYYFWNGPIAVLAESVSTEEDGSSPQPIGKQIWLEGFPPEQTSKLHVGQGYVWGYVEVTGQFKSGGSFGKDGAYPEFLQVHSAKAIGEK